MNISRRDAVQWLASLGIGASVIDQLGTQNRRELSEEETALVARALHRSLEDFQRVRNFDFRDDVGLATVFRPRP